MGEKIDVLEHAGEILPAVNKGVLLTSAANGKANTMTISWGMLGVEWARPVFVTFVREGLFTRTLLDETGEFTIGIPGEGFDRKILGRAGGVCSGNCRGCDYPRVSCGVPSAPRPQRAAGRHP